MSVFRILSGLPVVWLLFNGYVWAAFLGAVSLGALLLLAPDSYANRRRITWTRKAPWWWW